MSFRKIVIAIDGYSACGKSTTAIEVAKILGYRYIDTGAMYRAVTLYFLDNHISLFNPKEVAKALDNITIAFHTGKNNSCDTFLNGLNVEKQIRKMRVSEYVSPVSAVKEVRAAMVEQQRRFGKDRGVVMDGRDIGTVVFPHADLKIFMSADMLVRATRRQQELLSLDKLVDLDDVIANITNRDKIDTSREESPLRKADDALAVDTTYITLEEQVDEVARLAFSKILSMSEQPV